MEYEKKNEGSESGQRVTDLTYLREFSGGKEEFVKEMVQVFLEQNPIDLQVCEEALTGGDHKMIKAMAHALQTSLAFVGFPEHYLKELKQIEAMAEEKMEIAVIEKKAVPLIALCRKAQEELKGTVK